MPDREQAFTSHLINTYPYFLNFYSASDNDFNLDVFVLRDISKRYFKDVDRLISYHGMSGVDNHKIAGYTTYWIAKLRPISVVNLMIYKNQSEFCLYINEIFALFVSTGRMLSKTQIHGIRINLNFLSSFLYLLKYRQTSGDNLAMIYYLIDKTLV